MVSENNDHYENCDGNCDGRMRESVHSPLRVALMPLFKHGAINSQVLVHSHTWASPATGAVHRNLSRSMNTTVYFLWVRDGSSKMGNQFWCGDDLCVN